MNAIQHFIPDLTDFIVNRQLPSIASTQALSAQRSRPALLKPDRSSLCSAALGPACAAVTFRGLSSRSSIRPSLTMQRAMSGSSSGRNCRGCLHRQTHSNGQLVAHYVALHLDLSRSVASSNDLLADLARYICAQDHLYT